MLARLLSFVVMCDNVQTVLAAAHIVSESRKPACAFGVPFEARLHLSARAIRSLCKLGAVRNEADFGGAGTSDRTQPLLGVGAEYAWTRNTSVRLEYEDYGKVANNGFAGNNGSIKAANLSLGLKLAF